MATLKTVEFEDGGSAVSFHITKAEYELFRHGNKHFLLVPLASLQDQLTVGTLGNSYRMMLPKKFLKEHGIAEAELPKKADAAVFSIGDERFLVARIAHTKMGAPKFEDD